MQQKILETLCDIYESTLSLFTILALGFSDSKRCDLIKRSFVIEQLHCYSVITASPKIVLLSTIGDPCRLYDRQAVTQ